MLISALQISGVIMVASAGLWATFEKNLARMLGYALLLENGFSLLAVSTARDGDLKLFTFLILPRMVGFLFWSLTLSLLKENNSLELDSLNGLFRRKPTYAILIVVCCLSMGGFPLLASFPAQSALLAKIAQQSVTVAGISMLGSIGMLVAGFRALAIFVNSNSEEWLFQENRLSIIVLGVGVLLLLGLGFFPQLFSSSLINLLQAFGKIAGI
jgi:NADH:ubiquinone oxidoreductase subunit 2 (subunit N)